MPDIKFSGKLQDVYNADGTLAYQILKVPEITRSHCDMHAFRAHPVFRAYANSDLFCRLLDRRLKAAGIGKHIRIDKLPRGVTIDTSSFLARATIDLD